MRRPFPFLLTTLALGASLVAGTTTTAGAHDAAAPAKLTPTHFAFAATGFGSRVDGGMVSAGSDGSAYTVIGCTTNAGLNRNNYEAAAKIPGLGVAHGVRTQVHTTKVGRTYTSYSTHKIAKLTLANTSLGSLDILGIESISTAFNKNGRFGATNTTNIASIAFTPTGGKPKALRIPTPGRPLVVPGLARISVGDSTKQVDRQHALARSSVLDIKVIPTDTEAIIARSFAKISSGVRRGVFKGYSAAIRVSAAADNVKVGRTPLEIMPCQGTKGVPQVKDIARVTNGSALVARGVATGQLSINRDAVAAGAERGQVAEVSIGNAITINGIVGQVHVTRTRHGIVSDTKGSTVAELVVNGKSYDLPDVGKLSIPGVADFYPSLTTKLPTGLEVVGLRVSLLDGTGAVIDLGVAHLAVRKGPSA